MFDEAICIGLIALICFILYFVYCWIDVLLEIRREKKKQRPMLLLTKRCAKCPYWKNDQYSVGCGVPFSIMECEHFAKMVKKFEEQQ